MLVDPLSLGGRLVHHLGEHVLDLGHVRHYVLQNKDVKLENRFATKITRREVIKMIR